MTKESPREGATPVPATKRMAALRERRRKAGQTPMEVWAHPDDHQAIRDEAARLAKTRDESANVELRGAEQASLAERPSRTQGSASPSCED